MAIKADGRNDGITRRLLVPAVDQLPAVGRSPPGVCHIGRTCLVAQHGRCKRQRSSYQTCQGSGEACDINPCQYLPYSLKAIHFAVPDQWDEAVHWSKGKANAGISPPYRTNYKSLCHNSLRKDNCPGPVIERPQMATLVAAQPPHAASGEGNLLRNHPCPRFACQ